MNFLDDGAKSQDTQNFVRNKVHYALDDFVGYVQNSTKFFYQLL